MTPCREIRELMSVALDQALQPEEQVRLDAHLAGCEECRTALKEFQTVHQQIHGLEAVEPQPWLVSKIMARIRAETSPSFWRRFIRPLVIKPQFQVATILLLAGTSYYLLKTKESAARYAEQAAPRKSVATPQEKIQTDAPAQKPAETRNEAGQRKDDAPFAPPPPASTPVMAPVAKLDAVPSVAGGVAGPALENKAADTKIREIAKEESAGVAVVVVQAASAAPPSATGPDKTARSENSDTLARRAKKASPAKGEIAPAEQSKLKDAEADSISTEALIIRWEPTEAQTARPALEKELARLGGSILAQPEGGSRRALTARLDSRRFSELLERLERLGRIQESPGPSTVRSGSITVTIRW